MSNSIWKTPDQKPHTDQHVLFFAGGGIFPYLGFYYPKFDLFEDWESKDVQRWASVFDVIAQADKAERLQKAVDNYEKVIVGAMFAPDVGAVTAGILEESHKTIKQLIKE